MKFIVDAFTKTIGIFPKKSGYTTLSQCLGTSGQFYVDELLVGYNKVMMVRNPRDRFNSLWNANVPKKNYTRIVDFAEAVLTGDLKDNPHAYPQSRYCNDPDIVVYFETFDDSYNKIKGYFHGAKSLKHLNESPIKRDVWGALPQEYQDRLKDYYRGDYIRFGYTA